MDTQDSETTAGEAESRPTDSTQTTGTKHRLAAVSRTAPPPWWLTREPSRWDQAGLHLRCAALHAREVIRELWRCAYAAGGGAVPHRWSALVLACAVGAAALLLLTGCPRRNAGQQTAAKPMGAASTLTASAAASGEARSALDGAIAQTASKVAADVDAAAGHLDAVPPAVPDARAAITVAQSHLASVPRDPAESAALASASASRASGDTVGAERAIASLVAQARTDAAELSALRQRAADAERARDAAQAALIREGEQGAKRLADALDKERRGVLRSQVARLSWIGIGCCAGAAAAVGLGIAFGGVLALRRVGPAAIALGVIGLGCLGAAQIIGARWFLPVCVASGACMLAWFAVWSWRHQKRGDLAQEMATRSAKVAGVARTVVPVLDAAKEQATGEVAEWFRANVLAKLSSAMDREDKATVHAIRAESSASGPAAS